MSEEENIVPAKRKAPEESPGDLYVPLKKRRKIEEENVDTLLSTVRSRGRVKSRQTDDDPEMEILNKRRRKRKKKKKKKKKAPVSKPIIKHVERDEDEDDDDLLISFRKGSNVKDHFERLKPKEDEEEAIYGPTAKKSLLQLVLAQRKSRPKMSHEEFEREQEQRLLETVSYRRSLVHSGVQPNEETKSNQTVRPPPLQDWGWNPPQYILGMSEFEKKQILDYHKISISSTGPNPYVYPTLTWKDLRLPSSFIEGLQMNGMHKPTPVQSICLPILLKGRDMIGISYTGSGKTMVFLIPILLFSLIEETRLRVQSGEGPFCLVLCPNRELAKQTYDLYVNFSRQIWPNRDLNCLLCMGGTSFVQMDRVINRGLHAVIATPGRLIHLLEMRKFHLKSCKLVVMDEADRLVDLGFEKSIRTILDYLEDQKRQTVLISATMPPKIQSFAQSALREPIVVNVGRPGASSMNVQQDVEYIVDVEDLDEKLLDVIQKTGPPVLIFARDKMTVEHVYEFLLEKEINVAAIHGSKDQRERDYANNSFREGKKDILVATDMASKGLDFKDVQHVINYDIPNEIENYVHRIGRTGRWGRKKGLATSFVCFEKCDLNLLLDLKYLLIEAKQNVPDFLMKLEDTNDEDLEGEGCSYCGGLGHRITNCNKLMRDARKNLKRIQTEGEETLQ